MSSPRVSVLMAVKNGASFLPGALESLFAQTFKDFELIVINDGSTDSTQELLDVCSDPRLVTLANRETLGLAGALNRGLKIARGDYVARQDADDLSRPERLALQVAFLDANPHVVLVGTAYDVIDGQGHYLETQRQPLDDLAIRWQMLFHNAFLHSSVMLKNRVLREQGLVYDAGLRLGQDFALWSRLLNFGNGANLSASLVMHRIYPESSSSSAKPAQQAIATEIALGNMKCLLASVSLSVEMVSWLRTWYYSAPLLADNREMRHGLAVLELGSAFLAKYPASKQLIAAIRRQWMEKLLLRRQRPDFAILLGCLRQDGPLCLRQLLKRLLGRRLGGRAARPGLTT